MTAGMRQTSRIISRIFIFLYIRGIKFIVAKIIKIMATDAKKRIASENKSHYEI